ncbi:Uncharacterised protein [Mycobacteroides abscessus subsp. abscessus]|nr:Uncharacterised protein [Mycobacteroides abscessus subsp. abscessus]
MTVMTEAHVGWVPSDSLANRLVLVRQERKLSQRAAADQCGLTFGEWQSMELGRAARRVNVKVRQIAMALGVDRDWLMWGGPLAPEDDADPTGSAATSDKSSCFSKRVARVVDLSARLDAAA